MKTKKFQSPGQFGALGEHFKYFLVRHRRHRHLHLCQSRRFGGVSNLEFFESAAILCHVCFQLLVVLVVRSGSRRFAVSAFSFDHR